MSTVNEQTCPVSSVDTIVQSPINRAAEPPLATSRAGSNKPPDLSDIEQRSLGTNSLYSMIVEKDLEASKEGRDAKLKDDLQGQRSDGWSTDPENPWNWSSLRKWKVVFIVSLYTFFAPVSSSMMAPALPQIAEKYRITNATLVNMTLSTFLLAYATGPLFTSPLTEIVGRKWVLHATNILFLVFSLACAFAPDTGSLIGFRFLAGLGGGAPIAIGGGVIADLFEPIQRGSAMSFYILGPLIGPAIGPAVGGFITERIGFKWNFIIIAALAGLSGVFGLLGLEETYAPVIRARQARRRLEAGMESDEDKVILRSMDSTDFKRILWINFSRPFAILFTSSICFVLSFYMALTYGYYYLMFATFPGLFEKTYGFNTGMTGLAYLGPGCGFAFSTVVGGYILDGIYRRLIVKNDGVHKPEFRVPSMIVASFFVPLGLFWYGWSAQAKLHWIMPIIGSAIFGFAMMGTHLPLMLYLVDSFRYAASANAAAAVLRSLFGFAFPLFGEQMYATLGYGPGTSLLAGLAIVFGIPFPIWIYYYGEKMRQRSNLNR